MAFDPFTAGFDLVKTALDKFFPDADEEMKQKFAQANLEIQNQYNQVLQQLQINQVEAAHPSIFVAGWRPAIGWAGASGITYQVLLMPIGNAICGMFGVPPVFVTIDISLLQTLIGGMLGLTAARSWDKANGADTKQFKKGK